MSENKIRYECELIQDLLPLYQDNVCSNSSKIVVEEHLMECESCKMMMQQLKSTSYDEILTKEKNDVLGTHAKKERRRSTTIGLATAGVLMIPVIVCLICNLAIGHALDWFFLAAIPTIFGLSVVFMPYIVYQIALPDALKRQKGLLVMLWDTLWLYAIIFVCGLHSTEGRYWSVALSITTFCLVLPWGIFLCIRYTKGHPFEKVGWVTMITGGFISIVNDITNGIVEGKIHIRMKDADFSCWDSVAVINGNVMLIILLVSIGVGILLIGIGKVLKHKR